MDRLLSMRVFQRVIDEGGFASAARALDMSPAVVTRLISDLEQHLGTRLIQRTTRKLSLTDAGESYLQRVRGVLHDIEDAEAEASASTSEMRGTLRVLATPVLATYFLAPRVTPWLKRYPGVALDLAVDDFPQNRVEEFDVTFMVVEEGYNASVVARPLVTTEWILVAAPGYLKQAGTPKVPDDLKSHPHLRFPWHANAGVSGRRLKLTPVDGTGEAAEVDARVVLQSRNYDVLHRAALDGAGVATLSSVLCAPALDSGLLVRVLPKWVAGRFTIYAALPTRKLIPARTKAFMEFVREHVPGLAGGRRIVRAA
jgi:DNA-binding transcriptional LysR family regulator